MSFAGCGGSPGSPWSFDERVAVAEAYLEDTGSPAREQGVQVKRLRREFASVTRPEQSERSLLRFGHPAAA